MLKRFIISTLAMVSFTVVAQAATPAEVYKWIGALEGEWKLSKTEKQQGSCAFEEGEEPSVGIAFKQIGRNTTIQEDLLPDSERQMVTMYHCKDIGCTNIRGTHYCVKENQPVYQVNLKESTPNKIIMECDPSASDLCESNENYVYKVIHELSADGTKLKSSYLSKKDKKPIPSTICNFEK